MCTKNHPTFAQISSPDAKLMRFFYLDLIPTVGGTPPIDRPHQGGHISDELRRGGIRRVTTLPSNELIVIVIAITTTTCPPSPQNVVVALVVVLVVGVEVTLVHVKQQQQQRHPDRRLHQAGTSSPHFLHIHHNLDDHTHSRIHFQRDIGKGRGGNHNNEMGSHQEKLCLTEQTLTHMLIVVLNMCIRTEISC